MGLNDSYMNIRSQILMMSPLPTVGQAFSLLSQEESHRALSSVEAPIAAFYTSQTRVGSSMKERVNLFCDHCSWNGHTKDNCYKLDGYPPWHKLYRAPNKGLNKKVYKDNVNHMRMSAEVNFVEENNTDQPKATPKVSTGTGAPSVFTPGQYAEILKLLGSNNIQNDCAPVVNMAGTASQTFGTEWIIDTGANEHMIGDISLLQGSKSLVDSTGTVRLPNGSKANVNKIGSAPLTNSIQLEHDLRTERVMGIGKERHGLYYFTSKVVSKLLPKDSFTFPSSLSSFDRMYSCSVTDLCKDVSIDTWHKRLVFPQTSMTKSSCAFQLIHMDIWGPFHTPTYNGEMYFLTIVDDFTKGTWIYLMQSKMDVLRLIRLFFAMDTPVYKKGYKVLNLQSRKISISRDVVFHEHIFPFVVTSQSLPVFNSSSTTVDPLLVSEEPAMAFPLNEPYAPSPAPSDIPLRISTRTIVPPIWTHDYSCSLIPKHNPNTCAHPIAKHLTYGHFSKSYQSFLAAISSIKEPQFYHEAVTDEKRRAAMDEELNALERNHTWDVVDLPSKVKPIGCK
ncbi:uncharacterized protein [Primulina huaijiensis]|uniref:uncharacterized protein n=1 Tax=Primulina huaijiensis TaxID=1492673 RepID=UPI003CC6FD86